MTEPLLPSEKPLKKLKFSSVLTPVAVILALVLVALSSLKRFEKGGHEGEGHAHVEVKVGNTLPDIEFTTLDQKKVHLSSLPSKVTLINFWASWCGPCLKEIPSINSLRKKYQNQGFDVVGINVDENPGVVIPQFQKKLSMEFTSFVDPDGTIADLFDVHGIPFTVIVDANRKVLWVETGDQDWFSSEVQKQVAAWLGVSS